MYFFLQVLFVEVLCVLRFCVFVEGLCLRGFVCLFLEVLCVFVEVLCVFRGFVYF